MQERVRGRGSIVALDRKKDGTKLPNSKCRHWRLKVSTGREGVKRDGTPVYGQKTRRFTGTYREAVEALDKFRGEVGEGKVVKRSSWTLVEYAWHVHDVRKASGTLKEASLSTNESTIRRIEKAFGSVRLSDVDRPTIEQAYADLMSGKATGRKIKASTVSVTVHPYLCVLFKRAEKDGLVRRGVMDDVEPPKTAKAAKRALTEKDALEMVSRLSSKSGRDVTVALCLMCGLRISEAMALTWRDFVDGCACITKAAGRDGVISEGTKSDSGIRRVPVPDTLATMLGEWKEEQRSLFEDTVGWSEDTLVSAVTSRTTTYNALAAWWKGRQKKLGVDLSFHELRHTYASVLAARGVHPSVIQSLMGHSSASIAMDVYTHVNMAEKKAAVAFLSEPEKGFSEG